MHRWFVAPPLFVLALLALLAGSVSLHAQRADGTSRLTWISGCWRQTGTNGRVVEEQWMAPRGGILLGMSRTVRGDSLVEYEQLRIAERGAAIVYHAAPYNQPPAEFTAGRASDTLVVFENAQHDFPQRIIYRRLGPDSLVARIEGTVNGRSRGVDFPYERVRCPGP